jgi:hypothetical protein
MTHSQALEKTENALLLASQVPGFRFDIVTGNSSTLQQKIIKNILEKYNFSYYIFSSNLGKITVFDK